MFSIRYTYEVAPVFTLMEDAVLKRMMEMIGWEEGGDGLFNPGTVHTPVDFLHSNQPGTQEYTIFWFEFFLPGGSMSNMYAVNLARYRFCPDLKEVGLYSAPRLVLLTSQEVGLDRKSLNFRMNATIVKNILNIQYITPQIHRQ